MKKVSFKFMTSSERFLTGYIRIGDSAIDLFVEPGDSQYITVDLNNFDSTLEMGGQGAGNSKAYAQYQLIYPEVCKQIEENLSTQLEWPNYRAYMDSTQDEFRNKLAQMSEGLPKSDLYKDFETAVHYYLYLYNVLIFQSNNAANSSCRIVLDSLLQTRNNFDIIGLSTRNYIDFLALYPVCKMDSIEYRRLVSSPPSPMQIDSIFRHTFPGRVYAFWIVSQYYTAVWLSPTVENRTVASSFIKENIYPPYTKFMKLMYQKGIDLQRDDSLLEASNDLSEYHFKDINGDTLSFGKFRGHVILLDFWASWCGNCILEIPYLTKLQKKFKNKDIVFVSISVDEDSTKWTRAIDKHRIPGYQIRLSKENARILNALNVKGYPKYVLVNSFGKIADSNAKRPSDPRLIDDIERLLQE